MNKNRTRLNLEFVDTDNFGRDVYVDQNGDYIVNTNFRNEAPSWCTKYPRQGFDGEPDIPLNEERFKIVVNVWPEQIKFRYMLLSRLLSDIRYYLGRGNRFSGHLKGSSEKVHIDAMKELWNNLPVKPEWLPLKKLQQYERRVLNPKKI